MEKVEAHYHVHSFYRKHDPSTIKPVASYQILTIRRISLLPLCRPTICSVRDPLKRLKTSPLSSFHL